MERIGDTADQPPIATSPLPLNAETPLSMLTTRLTPTRSFYVRSHFDVPRIQAEGWRLALDGAVENPIRLSMQDLERFSSVRDLWATLECAGNGRVAMDPRPPGIPWAFGAVGTSRFTGVPVSLLLERAGPRPEAEEVLFVGADRGRAETGEIVSFARSLPLEVARHPDTLVAWAMDGQPLSFEHGFPARLVVPRWYAMASVKWLVEIRVLGAPFQGFFQTNDYVYDDAAGSFPSPVRLMRVRSVIGAPADGAEIPPGRVEVAGTAWSGHPPVVRVEVSVDGGDSWSEAELGLAPSPYASRPWRFGAVLGPGTYTITARASDHAGDTQPVESVWNARGYGNNVAHRIRITVTERVPRTGQVRAIEPGSPAVPA